MENQMNVVAEIVAVSEHKTYLDVVSRICYYNEPNLNGDMLTYDNTSLEKANTLISMPVQAKYRVNSDGTPSLGGHEMVRRKDGTVEFRTHSIGVHTGVEIKEDDVLVNNEVKRLPCLFASYRIWKRYPNYISAVKRLYENGILYGSWEINVYKYEWENGVRKISDYEFVANTLLGESTYPSYGVSATAISMAETNNTELLIAETFEALSQDLLDNTEDKEECEKMSEVEQNTEIAQLTDLDLLRKLAEACELKLRKGCYITFFFPNEKEVWCDYIDRPTELDYAKFTYEIGENDEVIISEPEYVKLTVSVSEINSKIAELKEETETVKAELDTKNEAIAKASETIQSLNVQISELEPFKAQVEAAEKEKVEAEITEEKKRLKEKLLKSGLFAETEIAEKEIQDLIEARDISAINTQIADRLIASFDVEGKTDTSDSNLTEETTATASLETSDEDTDIRSFMSKILFK